MKALSIAALVLLTITRTSLADAVFRLSDLPVGTQYQLVFVTAGLTSATSSDINYYNSFVAAEAALNPALPSNVTWRAVGSTSAVDARDNALSSGLPVYDVRGNLVAPYQFYGTGSHWGNISYDQFGVWSEISDIWTGTMQNGTEFQVTGPYSAYPLGFSYSAFGDNDYAVAWIDQGILPSTIKLPMYALSSPLTVPEPSTCALAAIGAIGLLALGRRNSMV